MYDVAKKKNVNGKTFILCFNDRDEGRLLQEFNKASASGTDQNADGKNSKQTIKFQFADLMIAAKKTVEVERELSHDYFSFNDNIISGTPEIKSPPPKA